MNSIQELFETHCDKRQALFGIGNTVLAASESLESVKRFYDTCIAPLLNRRRYRLSPVLSEEELFCAPGSGCEICDKLYGEQRQIRDEEDRPAICPRKSPQLLIFRPLANGWQAIANVCFARDSTMYKRPNWFAHYLYQHASVCWNPVDLLTLFGNAHWRHAGDDSSRQLVALETLPVPSEHAAVSEDVLDGFVCTAAGDEFWDPGLVIPQHFQQWSVEDRCRWLQDLITAYLNLDREARETLLLIAPPGFAALAFFGILRLLPTSLTEKCGFSTYETYLETLPVALCATTRSFYAGTDAKTNAVQVRAADERPSPQDGSTDDNPLSTYAVYAVEMLELAGIEVLDRVLNAANRNDAIRNLDDLNRFAEILRELDSGSAVDRFSGAARDLVREAAILAHFSIPRVDVSILAQSPSIDMELVDLARVLNGTKEFRKMVLPLAEHLPLAMLERQFVPQEDIPVVPLPDDICTLMYVRYLKSHLTFVPHLSPAQDDQPAAAAVSHAEVVGSEQGPHNQSQQAELDTSTKARVSESKTFQRHVKIAKRAFVAVSADTLCEAFYRDRESGLSHAVVNMASRNRSKGECSLFIKRLLLSSRVVAKDWFNTEIRIDAARQVLAEAIADPETRSDTERAIAQSPNLLFLLILLLRGGTDDSDHEDVPLRIALRASDQMSAIVRCRALPASFRSKLLKSHLEVTPKIPHGLEAAFYLLDNRVPPNDDQKALEVVLTQVTTELSNSRLLALFQNWPDSKTGFWRRLLEVIPQRSAESGPRELVEQLMEQMDEYEILENATSLGDKFVALCTLDQRVAMMMKCVAALDKSVTDSELRDYVNSIKLLTDLKRSLGNHCEDDAVYQSALAWLELDVEVLWLIGEAKRLQSEPGEWSQPIREFIETCDGFKRAIGNIVFGWSEGKSLARKLVEARQDNARHLTESQMAALMSVFTRDAAGKEIQDLTLAFDEDPCPLTDPDVQTHLHWFWPANFDPAQVAVEMSLTLKSLKSSTPSQAQTPEVSLPHVLYTGIFNPDFIVIVDRGISKAIAKNDGLLELKLTFRSHFWGDRYQERTLEFPFNAGDFPYRGNYYVAVLRDREDRKSDDPMFMDGVFSKHV